MARSFSLTSARETGWPLVALITIPLTVIKPEAGDEEPEAGTANDPRIEPLVCPAAAGDPSATITNNRVLRYPGYLDGSQICGKCNSSRE